MERRLSFKEYEKKSMRKSAREFTARLVIEHVEKTRVQLVNKLED